MRSTVEQLRLTAQNFYARARSSRSRHAAARLQALADAVSAQAVDIENRADQLTHDIADVSRNSGEVVQPEAVRYEAVDQPPDPDAQRP